MDGGELKGVFRREHPKTCPCSRGKWSGTLNSTFLRVAKRDPPSFPSRAALFPRVDGTVGEKGQEWVMWGTRGCSGTGPLPPLSWHWRGHGAGAASVASLTSWIFPYRSRFRHLARRFWNQTWGMEEGAEVCGDPSPARCSLLPRATLLPSRKRAGLGATAFRRAGAEQRKLLCAQRWSSLPFPLPTAGISLVPHGK